MSSHLEEACKPVAFVTGFFVYLNMGTIFAFDNAIQRIQVRPIIALCLEQSQYEVLSFNRGQLYMGEDNKGRLLSPMYRSQAYADFKESLNPKPGYGIPDLFVTGEFYNSIQIKVNPSQFTFTIFSENSKAPKLERKYGQNIYGLNEENKQYFGNEIIRPKIVAEFKKQIGL